MGTGEIEQLEELRFQVPKGNRYIVVRKANGKEELHDQHVIFRMKLKHDDTLYAVDLLGSLFGLSGRPVVKWPEYKMMVGLENDKYEAKPGGWHRDEERKQLKDRYANLKADKKYRSTKEELDILARSYVTDRVYLAIKEWVEERGLTLAKVIHNVDDE